MQNTGKNQTIEQFVKEYLTSKNIEFEAKNEKEECEIVIYEKYGLYYVEVRSSFYIKDLYPGDEKYPLQAGGEVVRYYDGKKGYRFVCDKDFNIIIDLAMIHFYESAPEEDDVFLDEQNLFVPIKKRNEQGFFRGIQHFRIEDGKSRLFKNFCTYPYSTTRLREKKLVVYEGQLYDFEKGAFVGNKFDNIITEESYHKLMELAQNWGIPYDQPPVGNRREEFVVKMKEKIQREDLLLGYICITAKRDDIISKYDVAVFLDMEGNPNGELYYREDLDLLSVPVTSKTLSLVLQRIKVQAEKKVEDELTMRNRREEIFSKIKVKLFNEDI